MNLMFMSTLKPSVSEYQFIRATYNTLGQKYSTKNEASFKIQPFKLHKLKEGPDTKVTITRKCALKLYENLVTVRQMETAASNLYKAKLIRGFCHLYIGEEAVAVGMQSSFRTVDSVITSYRCHGWTYLMGVSVLGVLSELAGRKTGCSRGKGGSMHMYAPNFYGSNGIVGAQIPLGVGFSLAHNYKSDGGVAFTIYGDGAANQGQLFESYNAAKLWNLPCVFVCENNLYGLGTQINRAAASTEFYKRGDYIPGIWVNGMDVLATRVATQFAINYCASGKGPLILEMETYRYTGHSMSDPGTSYRTRDEIQKVRSTRDPIKSFKERIIKAHLVTTHQLKEVDSKVRTVVQEALKQLKKESEISLEELSADIYKLCLEPNSQIRGICPNDLLKHISKH